MRIALHVDTDQLHEVVGELEVLVATLDEDEVDDLAEPARVIVQQMEALEQWLADYRRAITATGLAA
jgi:hypothetical protein